MKTIGYITIIILLATSLLTTVDAVYAEEKYEDVLASVVVGSVFQVTVDNSSLNFGSAESGQRVELYPDRYYNQATCISNHGKTWYLKMYAQNDLVGASSKYVISRESIEWYVSWTNGSGVKVEGWHNFEEDTPSLVYTSGFEDNYGGEVFLQFKYALTVPGEATSDSYFTVISYTLTESP
ncbi:MAG: hypothetical protein A2Z72_07570 [Omnitrophica bacterium RBG_13_46_9]|nr:MAG: hypothetical protein A2Z72_07570 [Omnitrophica bacterium RBG_13_46_9]